MKTKTVPNPYSLPTAFRAYVYDAVVLAQETKRVNINTIGFNKHVLLSDCGINVLMVESLDEVELHDLCPWPEDDFFVFHKGKENGYTVLFKRLRDTFAHGHFESNSEDWIVIRHRYKGRGERVENTRAFGHMQIGTLRKLVSFLDTANRDAI